MRVVHTLFFHPHLHTSNTSHTSRTSQPGEAWRAALLAAADNGAQAVVLGDMPTSISGRRLTRNVGLSALARLGVTVGTTAGLLWAQGAGQLPGEVVDYVPAAIGAVAVLCVLPLVWPVWAVGALAEKKGDAIEEAVAVKEPIQVWCFVACV